MVIIIIVHLYAYVSTCSNYLVGYHYEPSPDGKILRLKMDYIVLGFRGRILVVCEANIPYSISPFSLA